MVNTGQLNERRQINAVKLAAQARLRRDDDIAHRRISRPLKAARAKASARKVAFATDDMDIVADYLSEVIADSENVLDGRGASMHT